MNILTYLKDKISILLIHFVVIIFTGVFLSAFHISYQAIYLLIIIYLFAILATLLIDYIPRRNWYNNVRRNLENLENKYMLSELIEEPDFMDGKILYSCLHLSNKSMNDEIAKYAIASKEYREYIELWIHEVKTPMASSKLIIENNPSEITQSLWEELNIIDYYLEQALFYSRSNGVEKDYIIKETPLRDLVNNVIRRNSKSFIRNKIKLTLENLNHSVLTDSKWMEFILNQIVINAIKYSNENSYIRIYEKENNNNITLFIEDNGIGISEKDLPRVFEKGYTGQAGRQYVKSTGIGLYLCKKLCDRLGLLLQIESKESTGTTVSILFPKNNSMDVLKQ
jgi:Signal transduction histidine kinase